MAVTESTLAVADRANNARVLERDGRWTVQGDPTEGALLVAARKCGLRSDLLDQRCRVWGKCRSPPSGS